ncbi:MAG: hypothetical protein OEY51_00520 [Cyclobacteriaceae bacterium]|nr:hypothetical protein [Cyclobacteriaceae bacterium]
MRPGVFFSSNLSTNSSHLTLAALSTLAGWCFYQMGLFVNHFYVKPLTDLYILAFIFLVVFTVRIITSRGVGKEGFWFLIPLHTLASLYSTYLSWHIFSYTEFSYVPVYLSVAFLAFTLGGYTRERRKARGIIMSSFIAVGFLIALASNVYLLGATVMGLMLPLLFRDMQRAARSVIPSLIILLVFPFLPLNISWYDRQQKYYDKVIFSEETRFQTVDVTEWKGHYWYYYNGKNQFSSIDYPLYYEPLVLPALGVVKDPGKVLVLGGENGLAPRELMERTGAASITLLPVDKGLVAFARSHPLFTSLNGEVFRSNRITVENEEIFDYLYKHPNTYDIIIADLPDPTDIETNQWYTNEFYHLVREALRDEGVFVSQAGSPYFSGEFFYGIQYTMRNSGLDAVPYHNQIPTLGEWGWYIARKGTKAEDLSRVLQNTHFPGDTRWINSEAMNMMLSFGKKVFTTDETRINFIKKPHMYKIYNKGTFHLEE